MLLRVDFDRTRQEFGHREAGMDRGDGLFHMGAAEHIASGSRHALRTRYCRGSRPHMRLGYAAVQVDQEGSLHWALAMQAGVNETLCPGRPSSRNGRSVRIDAQGSGLCCTPVRKKDDYVCHIRSM